MVRQRIEYIDAMRGFTMILVVYSHVCGFCFDDYRMAWNDIFFLLRQPCFFFISGWLFEPVKGTMKEIAVKKMRTLIIPTFIFLLLLAPPPFFFHQLGTTKGGYWFTFVLFEFFMLYLLTGRKSRRWGTVAALCISVLAYCYAAHYNHYFRHIEWIKNIMGGLSVITWRYYIFFFIGTMAKRYSPQFMKFTSNPYILTTLVAMFAISAMLPHPASVPASYAQFVISGTSGLILTFTFFRKTASALSKKKLPGKWLQFIGRRTLDIYMIHYFLLPRFLMPYGEPIRSLHCKPAEAAVVLALSLVVLAACLLISYILRKSPFLARYLFGVQGSSNTILG